MGRCKDTQANSEFGIVVAVFIVIIIYINSESIEMLFYLTKYIFISLSGILLVSVLSVYFFLVAEIVNRYLRKRRENLKGETSWTYSRPETHEEYLVRMAEVTKKGQEKLAKEYEENREEREKNK